MKQKELIDIEMDDLPSELRWREWMKRVEAVLFASAKPVSREGLSRIIGKDISLDTLIDDLNADLEDRPYQVKTTSDGWILCSKKAYAPFIRMASYHGDTQKNLSHSDMVLLSAIAYFQPITREELSEILGREISRGPITRLKTFGLISSGPRSPGRGGAFTFVTTDKFLVYFDMESLLDLPEIEPDFQKEENIIEDKI